jgi:uncharacterized protein (TIGR02594 family)
MRWIDIAKGEIGVKEIVGGENPRILEYHDCCTLDACEDEVPWCSAFTNWAMKECAIKGTKLANARSWLDWGVTLDKPRVGCVVILRRGNNGTSGHVGFVVGWDDYYLEVLGGNQSDQVKVSKYKKSDALGYRWPEGA